MDDGTDRPRGAADSTEAIAQSRTGGATPPSDSGGTQPGEGELYVISDRVELAHATRPYERKMDDPLYRTLPVFALDASTGDDESRVTTLKLPYEPLAPGPVGAIIEVDATIEGELAVERAELDHPRVLLEGGYRPSITAPKFHQQMVYAVASHTYGQFQMALGRQPAWGFDRRGADGNNRLVLRPFGTDEANAWYDRSEGEVRFGFFRPEYSTPTVPAREGSYVFLSLSHDIIVHEVTHALLDGLRPEFHVASHPDVPAFHEAFADLVAVFQRFTHEDVVTAALTRSRGDLSAAEALFSVGAEFGRAIRREQTPLRTLYEELGRLGEAMDKEDAEPPPLPAAPHERGLVLARAVFRAFATVYKKKAKRYVRLATGGSGVLPAGEISEELRRFLSEEIRRIAGQFASICIRAIDYCPPVDVRFGDYLRALITADLDLVPDDDWGYRAAIISSFGAEGIYGEGTAFMTEEALRWLPPQISVPPMRELSFAETRFDGDPGRPATAAELRRQAGAIGRLVAQPRLAREFGLVSPKSAAFRTGEYGHPVVTSVRSARRVGPDMQVTFDTVAEVVQTRVPSVGGVTLPVLGGSTVVVGPKGEIRYLIRKRVDHEERMREQAAYVNSSGFRFWESDGAAMAPRADGLRLMCTSG